jgi:hypothetical protein
VVVSIRILVGTDRERDADDRISACACMCEMDNCNVPQLTKLACDELLNRPTLLRSARVLCAAACFIYVFPKVSCSIICFYSFHRDECRSRRRIIKLQLSILVPVLNNGCFAVVEWAGSSYIYLV